MTQKRVGYITWDEYFMDVARLSAQRSKDSGTQVEVCTVSEDSKILSMGYNGLLKDCSNDEFSWDRTHETDDPYNVKYFYSTYSELSAILNYRGGSLESSEFHMTLFPCNKYAGAIVQAGTKTLIYGEDKYVDTPAVRTSKRMPNATSVRYYRCEPTGGKIEIEV